MKTELFLTLDDAVRVVCDRLNLIAHCDREWLRNELEQVCYISNDEYSIGFEKARKDIMDMIERMEGE